MWKSGTFDLTDINEELIKEIVFFDIFYGALGEPSSVIFFTESGDEYIISERGTEWDCVDDIVENFPEIYEVYRTKESNTLDEYGLENVGRWIKIPILWGELLVRKDYFERFYDKCKSGSEMDKEIPLSIVRNVLGRKTGVPGERMVYIKTQESLDQEQQQKEIREKERIENRLSLEEVPWIEYRECPDYKGHIRFWIRKNANGTLSAYRWCIQEQKEQFEEGSTSVNAPVECYNLFLP